MPACTDVSATSAGIRVGTIEQFFAGLDANAIGTITRRRSGTPHTRSAIAPTPPPRSAERRSPDPFLPTRRVPSRSHGSPECHRGRLAVTALCPFFPTGVVPPESLVGQQTYSELAELLDWRGGDRYRDPIAIRLYTHDSHPVTLARRQHRSAIASPGTAATPAVGGTVPPASSRRIFASIGRHRMLFGLNRGTCGLVSVVW